MAMLLLPKTRGQVDYNEDKIWVKNSGTIANLSSLPETHFVKEDNVCYLKNPSIYCRNHHSDSTTHHFL